MRKPILLAPIRKTNEYPNGKGVSAVIPSCIDPNKTIFKADFNFICKVCKYIKEHGNKEDKKWIENLVWNDLIPVYKNNNVDSELVEHLIAQVTDCVAWTTEDK